MQKEGRREAAADENEVERAVVIDRRRHHEAHPSGEWKQMYDRCVVGRRMRSTAELAIGFRGDAPSRYGQACATLWLVTPSTLIKDHLAGGASRLAALLLPQILQVFSVVAPCHPGAALRDLVLVQRGRATSLDARPAAATRTTVSTLPDRGGGSGR